MVAEIECHEGGSRLDQAASNQGLLAPQVISVPRSNLRIFTFKIKRRTSPVPQQQVHGLPLIGSQRIHGTVLIKSGFQHIKLLQQRQSIVQTGRTEPLGIWNRSPPLT